MESPITAARSEGRSLLWFELDPQRRAAIASAYEDIPLAALPIARLEALALGRAFGMYETVAELLVADAKIRHVRNLGRLGLARIDAVLRPLLEAGVATSEEALEHVAALRGPSPGIDHLEPEDYDRIAWHDADPDAREVRASRYLEMPLSAWGLSTRARNALRVAGKRTVADVLGAGPEIARARGIGHRTLCELHARSVATLRGTDAAALRWEREVLSAGTSA